MKTILIKVSENEYRVQDIKYDYSISFNKWINDIDGYKNKFPSLWNEIKIKEFESFGCGIISVWNRNNDLEFNYPHLNLNPIMHFAEETYYYEDSQNEYVNLILNLHKLNIIDNLKVKNIEVRGNKHHLNCTEIEECFNKKNTFLVEVYSYGYNNKLIAEINKNNFTKSSIPKYNIFENRYLKLLKNLN